MTPKALLRACRSRSFNEHYDVCPWSDSILSTLLKSVTKDKLNRMLIKSVVERALEFKEEYGVWGSKHFHLLEDHAREMYDDLGAAKKITKKNFWTVVDIAAINSLRIGGQRVGDTQIDLYHLFS